jgi:hypothetical protein
MNQPSVRRARTIATMLASAAGGAAITAVLLLARDDDARPPAPSPIPPAEAVVAPVSRPLVADGVDLAAVHTKLDAMHASLRALDAKVDAALVARTAAAASTAIDPNMLRQALMEAEAGVRRAKFDAMQPRDVLRAAGELTNARKDLGTAQEMLQALLERPLQPEERQEALVQLGIVTRERDDVEGSRRTFEQAVTLAGGAGTARGAEATYQLAWTHHRANDVASALRCFDQAATAAQAGRGTRIYSRWFAARMRAEAGQDLRTEFEALLRDIGEETAFQHIANEVKTRFLRR